MKFFVPLLLIIFTISGHAQTLNAAQMSYWHKLLHYRSHWHLAGKVISEVDSPDFFVSKEGKSSPQKELKAFIEVLDSPKAQEYVCRFPLRYKWLKQTIPNKWNYTTTSCEIYNSFVGKLDAKNLSLVFSSFYINNPGSTFGHTFLRVSRYRDFHQNELLDYAINFAAQDTKDNVAIYMLKGLGGFYPGKFSVVPYYYKIREYNDHEFRDIWDYDLGLSQEQISRVIDHVWEMGSIHFDYFYFTENCSYHILGLLNVAYDDINIMKVLSPIYVLPIDTVKVMKDLGLIKDRKVRGSAYRKLLKETEGFSQKKMDLVKKTATHPELASDFSKKYNEKEAADLLDASISALDYLKAREVLLNDKKITEQREKLLILRAENPHISETIKYDEKKIPAPDDAHNSSRFGLFAGDRYQQGTFSGFEWRAAQHELLDPSQGHLKNSQVVMSDVRFRYQTIDFEKQNFILDRFRLVDLKKYQASDFWNSSVSFDLAVGLDQRKECKSKDCVDPVLTFGVGSTTEIASDYNLTFLLGGSYLYDRIYENNSLLQLGPKMNFLILKDTFALGLDVAYFLPTELFDGWMRRRISYDLDVRYFLYRNTALFIKNNNIDQDVGVEHEVQGGAYWYF